MPGDDQVLPSHIARALSARRRRLPLNCDQCGKRFVGTVRAAYCGPTCKKRAYRARQRAARP